MLPANQPITQRGRSTAFHTPVAEWHGDILPVVAHVEGASRPGCDRWSTTSTTPMPTAALQWLRRRATKMVIRHCSVGPALHSLCFVNVTLRRSDVERRFHSSYLASSHLNLVAVERPSSPWLRPVRTQQFCVLTGRNNTAICVTSQPFSYDA